MAKLNVQGLARRDPLLMRALVPDGGSSVVSIDLCFPPDTEYLTRRGWVPILELNDGEEVWSVDPQSLKGSFTLPSRILKQPYEGDMVSYVTVRGTLTATRDHRLFLCGQYNHPRPDKKNYRMWSTFGRQDFKSSAHLTLFTLSDTTSNYSDEDIWRAAAVQADGSIVGRDMYTIEVSKLRKKEKLRQLFGDPGYSTTKVRPGHTMPVSRWRVRFKHELLNGKKFDLSRLGANQAETFAQALKFWDGDFTTTYSTGRVFWCTTDKSSADEVQQYFIKSGYECKLKTNLTKNPKHKTYYTASIRKHGQIRLYQSRHKRTAEMVVKHYSGMVGCVTVNSGLIVVRQHGQCYVVSNCAGEPTIVAEMSKDPAYRYAVCDGVGQRPYYKDGTLYIDDVYLMVMSRSPIGKDYLRGVVDNWDVSGKTFTDQWMEDREAILKVVKTQRNTHKIMVLGLMYGMGPTTMVKHMYNKGYQLTPKDAKAFHTEFWSTFGGVKAFSKAAQRTVERDRRLVNPFGYRCVPEPHKAFNAYIQSSVNGIIGVFCIKLFTIAPYAKLITIIHDELLVEVPDDKLEQFRTDSVTAVQSLNDDLGWSIAIRTGFVVGKDWYDAK